jgi:CheY-like chemotaxis protein
MDRKTLIYAVDDDQSLLYSMARFLSRYDVEVKTLSNGFEVLLMCMYMVPDLIISDIRMPKLDGVSLLQGLKNNEATKDVPVIFMSAYPSDRIMEQAKELGARYFLIKPFPLEYIQELLPRALPQIHLNALTPAKEARG